jgi:hypothetical protein
MALEILEGKLPEATPEASSSSALRVNNKPAAPPRKRKTADQRKKEIAALLDRGKTEDEIMAATGLGRASVKMYFSILKARTKDLLGCKAAPAQADEDDSSDEDPKIDDEDKIDGEIRKLHALKLTNQQMAKKIGKSKGFVCRHRNRMGLPTNGKKGRPLGARRSGKPAEEGEFPIIGGTKENPTYGSMRMKVIGKRWSTAIRSRCCRPGMRLARSHQKMCP